MTLEAIKFNAKSILELAKQYSDLESLTDQTSAQKKAKIKLYVKSLLASTRKLVEEERQNAV